MLPLASANGSAATPRGWNWYQMGKPYGSDLQCLEATYEWALQLPIEQLRAFVERARGIPLVAVGSGGSFTAAHLARLLHERSGTVANSITPLDLFVSPAHLRETTVLLLTARGRNTDIQAAFRRAARAEPRQVLALCMATRTTLRRLSTQYRYTEVLECDLPSGRDGFLATNSLIATATLLLRAYATAHDDLLPSQLVGPPDRYESLRACERSLLDRRTWVVLFGGWAGPAAVDVESKFTEAALGNVRLADYRNFAHGRHLWLAKRGAESAVLALITPDDQALAEQTLALLPDAVPKIRLTTSICGPVGGLDLLVQVLHLVQAVASARGIDPGQPRVPPFGRRLYHLHLPSIAPETPRNVLGQRESLAISRKWSGPVLTKSAVQQTERWSAAYQTFLRRLEQARFGAVVFDYDGTLCDPAERFIGPSKAIGRAMLDLLRGGIIIGIATGRGKSVRSGLERVVPNKHRERVFIGYYNASDIAPLSETTRPDADRPAHPSLLRVRSALDEIWHLHAVAEYECRPGQISVIPRSPATWRETRAILLDVVAKTDLESVQVLESSHSLDVLAPGVSKRNLVAACERAAGASGKPPIALCIGDRGEWPGNDCTLLATQYSLSVDRVSPDPSSCWNLAPPGFRGAQATLAYLAALEFVDGALRFNSRRLEEGEA